MYKVLVVDDEEIIRSGIVRYLMKQNAEMEIIGEAGNGIEALNICECVIPDIIITDILMPKMDGIQLIKKVKEIYPEVKVIIISGHDEFAYAQSALSLNVAEYLLKPFLPVKLEAILQKVKEGIDKQRNLFKNINAMKERIEQSLPIVRERFLSDLVTGLMPPYEVQNKSHLLNLNISANYYTVAIIRVDKQETVPGEEISRNEMIQLFLRDTVGTIMGSEVITHTFAISDSHLGIILCACSGQKPAVFMNINNSLNKLIKSMEEHYQVYIFIGLGNLYDDILKLPVAYNEAREAISYSFACGAGMVIHYDEVFLGHIKQYERPVELYKEIILYTKICRREEALQKLETLFEYYRSHCAMMPTCIKTDAIELVLMLQRYIEESKGNFYFLYSKSESPYEQIQKADNLNRLNELLQHFIGLTVHEIERLKEGQSTHIIDRLKAITEENIDNELFNLDCAAAKLFISPNYLRQLFKQQMGETYLEYLTRERMKKAAELLADNSVKINEVSERVGYGSQSYFSKCFKKFYRTTPSEFRQEVTAVLDEVQKN